MRFQMSAHCDQCLATLCTSFIYTMLIVFPFFFIFQTNYWNRCRGEMKRNQQTRLCFVIDN